jgi:hypothetical protein|tara:strand:- start:973 stop:1323 length:351 start_codon:yes stop_codon:yes gene_type:complete
MQLTIKQMKFIKLLNTVIPSDEGYNWSFKFEKSMLQLLLTYKSRERNLSEVFDITKIDREYKSNKYVIGDLITSCDGYILEYANRFKGKIETSIAFNINDDGLVWDEVASRINKVV